MDMSAYVLGTIVESRLQELRAQAMRHHVVARARRPARRWRTIAGEGLIRLGRLVRGKSTVEVAMRGAG